MWCHVTGLEFSGTLNEACPFILRDGEVQEEFDSFLDPLTWVTTQETWMLRTSITLSLRTCWLCYQFYLKNCKNWSHSDVVMGSSQQMAVTAEFDTIAKIWCCTWYWMWWSTCIKYVKTAILSSCQEVHITNLSQQLQQTLFKTKYSTVFNSSNTNGLHYAWPQV